jgi:hypothetical protein
MNYKNGSHNSTCICQTYRCCFSVFQLQKREPKRTVKEVKMGNKLLQKTVSSSLLSVQVENSLVVKKDK